MNSTPPAVTIGPAVRRSPTILVLNPARRISRLQQVDTHTVTRFFSPMSHAARLKVPHSSALNQLRQAIQRSVSDDDLKRAIRDFDSADAEFQTNQEKFLSNVDPLLDARQQAKLRIFQVMADNRMRQILNNFGTRTASLPSS